MHRVRQQVVPTVKPYPGHVAWVLSIKLVAIEGSGDGLTVLSVLHDGITQDRARPGFDVWSNRALLTLGTFSHAEHKTYTSVPYLAEPKNTAYSFQHMWSYNARDCSRPLGGHGVT